MTTYYMVNDLDLSVSEYEGELVQEAGAALIRAAGGDIAVSGPLFTDQALADLWLREVAMTALGNAMLDEAHADGQQRSAMHRLARLRKACRELGLPVK